MDCAGKSFLIFGGLGGIGIATCKSLLGKGAKNVGIFDLVENTALTKSLVDCFPSANVKFWKADATDKKDIDYAFKTALSEFKIIDVIINCVGVVDEGRPERCIEINLLASVNLNYAAIGYLSKANGGTGGTVVNVASMAGLEPFSLCPVYCATKFGLVGLTRALGTDFYFEKTGMKFIAICPGFTTTPLMKCVIDAPVHDVRQLPEGLPLQSAEICGSLLVEALEQHKNGSLWNISTSNLSEIVPPTYTDKSTRV